MTIGEFILIPVVWAIRMTSSCFVCVLFTQGNGRRDGTKNLVQIAAAVGFFLFSDCLPILTFCFTQIVDSAPRLVFANAVSPPPVTPISVQRRHRFAYRYVRRER